MANPEWGVKHFCQACGAKFYDLHREDAICPKCKTPAESTPAAKPRRAPAARATAVSEATAPTAKLAVEKTGEAPPPEPSNEAALKALGVDGDDSDDGKENADLIEDPSELGEDADDMAEVVATSHGDETP